MESINPQLNINRGARHHIAERSGNHVVGRAFQFIQETIAYRDYVLNNR